VLHSLAQDNEGNLYFSDEFNHRVISVNCSGTLRWQVGGKGSGPGQFQYPRGLAIGILRVHGKAENCLAICDSWNNRVQFLGCDGGHRLTWHEAGGRGFKEISDIHFLKDNPAGDAQWLLLDRGNHRLCAMDPEGRVLATIGQPLPPDLAMRRQQASSGFSKPSPKGAPEFETLYYPARILGNTGTSLCLVEPAANRLKRILLGSFLPLPSNPPPGSAWIAASDGLFLAWSSSTRQLSWLDGTGKVVYGFPIEGKPVPTNCAIDQVWLHHENRLEQWRFDAVGQLAASQIPFESLLQLIEAEAEKTADPGNAEYHHLVKTIESVFCLCERLIDLAECPESDCAAINALWESVNEAALHMRNAFKGIHSQRSTSALLALKLLNESSSRPEVKRRLVSIQLRLQPIAEFLHRASLKAIQYQDRAVTLRIQLHFLGNDRDRERARSLEPFESMLEDLFASFLGNLPPQLKDATPSPTPSAGSASENAGGYLWPAARASYSFSGHSLREVDRWPLVRSGGQTPVHPHTILQAGNGDFLVSLFGRGIIVRLDPSGKIIGEFPGTESGGDTLHGPMGIAFDSLSRFWILEHNAHRVWICSFDSHDFSEVKVLALPGVCLASACSIIPAIGGKMLIADSNNHRIILLSDSGAMQILCGRSGTASGEFRFPVDLCINLPDTSSGFWVVDKRNHRLQLLDWSGAFQRQIGLCGLSRDSLLVPCFISQFEDGTIAVNQQQFVECIKLFSPEGKEMDCLPTDYTPAGMFAAPNHLFVSDWNDGTIRVYERMR
jgi:hypothetical protein